LKRGKQAIREADARKTLDFGLTEGQPVLSLSKGRNDECGLNQSFLDLPFAVGLKSDPHTPVKV